MGTEEQSEKEECTDDKPTITRAIVYSSDIKGITQDSDHVSLETLPHIRKIITEALDYLDALDTLKPVFGKNSDLCVLISHISINHIIVRVFLIFKLPWGERLIFLIRLIGLRKTSPLLNKN
jgi:hypothetical protein